MKITIVKIDHYDATVKFTPNWLEKLFGKKTRMEQFQKTHATWHNGENAWRSYTTAKNVGILSKLHRVLTNTLWLTYNKAKGVL